MVQSAPGKVVDLNTKWDMSTLFPNRPVAGAACLFGNNALISHLVVRSTNLLVQRLKRRPKPAPSQRGSPAGTMRATHATLFDPLTPSSQLYISHVMRCFFMFVQCFDCGTLEHHFQQCSSPPGFCQLQGDAVLFHRHTCSDMQALQAVM